MLKSNHFDNFWPSAFAKAINDSIPVENLVRFYRIVSDYEFRRKMVVLVLNHSGIWPLMKAGVTRSHDFMF